VTVYHVTQTCENEMCFTVCFGDFRVVIWPCYFFINMFWWITGLEKVWDVKPLINGKDVMKVLQLKGGPLVKEWVSHSAYYIVSPKWCSSAFKFDVFIFCFIFTCSWTKQWLGNSPIHPELQKNALNGWKKPIPSE